MHDPTTLLASRNWALLAAELAQAAARVCAMAQKGAEAQKQGNGLKSSFVTKDAIVRSVLSKEGAPDNKKAPGAGPAKYSSSGAYRERTSARDPS